VREKEEVDVGFERPREWPVPLNDYLFMDVNSYVLTTKVEEYQSKSISNNPSNISRS
jgi:hypothetical protein